MSKPFDLTIQVFYEVDIGVEYRNCHRNFDVYLLVAIWIGQIQSKPIYKLVTYIPSSPLVTSALNNFD